LTSDLEKRWKHLEAVFGADRARQVTTARLRRYVAERIAAKAAPATVQRELACLRRMFRLGFQAEKVARVPHFPSIRVDNVRKGFFERAEFDALLAELPEHLRPPAILGYWLGWRRGEVLALEWRQIDLEAGEIRLDPGTTKNKDGRVAYLPQEALDGLRQWRSKTSEIERREGRIIDAVCHRGGKPIRDFYRAWRDACDRAGVPGKTYHDFRRTAARNYVRAGVPERVAQAVLGHKTRSIFDRYNVVAEGDLREAAKRVESAPVGANRPNRSIRRRRLIP
jgi:integrase